MYLIDGHNLIGSGCVPGINLEQEDDEWRLVQWLRGRQPRLNRPIVVVFDGGIPGGTSLALSGGGVQVVFAAQRRIHADAIILQRVRDELVRDEIVAVTNDGVLIEAVRGLGARVMRPSAFAEAVKKRSSKPKARPKRAQAEPKLSRGEVADWLDLFEERETGKK